MGGNPFGAVRVPHTNSQNSELRSQGSTLNNRFQEDSRGMAPLTSKHIFPCGTEGPEALLVHIDMLAVRIWVPPSRVSPSLLLLASILCPKAPALKGFSFSVGLGRTCLAVQGWTHWARRIGTQVKTGKDTVSPISCKRCHFNLCSAHEADVSGNYLYSLPSLFNLDPL